MVILLKWLLSRLVDEGGGSIGSTQDGHNKAVSVVKQVTFTLIETGYSRLMGKLDLRVLSCFLAINSCRNTYSAQPLWQSFWCNIGD